MDSLPKRHAISRARFFLEQAKQCQGNQRDEFEAYLEASIVFSRAALHRLKSAYEKHPDWNQWWDSLLSNPSVNFFRNERDWILKNAPPKIGQVIRVGGPKASYASELYYYEDKPATLTVERHLDHLETLVRDAESRFAMSTRLGRGNGVWEE